MPGIDAGRLGEPLYCFSESVFFSVLFTAIGSSISNRNPGRDGMRAGRIQYFWMLQMVHLKVVVRPHAAIGCIANPADHWLLQKTIRNGGGSGGEKRKEFRHFVYE